MATRVVMAQLSPTMEEGRLLEWKVSEGDRVEASDVLAEIETDKANMDIEALGGGVLRRILVGEGETVPVGSLIGIIAEEDEDISDLLAEAEDGAGPAAATETTEEADAEEVAEEAPAEAEGEPAGEAGAQAADAQEGAEPRPGATPEQTPEEAEGGRIKASPVARRMAEEEGLSLAGVEGSGPGGRIVKKDVEAALEAGEAARPARAPAAAAPEGRKRPTAEVPARPPSLEEERLELTQMRKAIAKRLVQSLGPVPHFFLTTEIDMGRALDLRAELNERLAEGKIGVNDLLVKTVAEALARHPEINASWDGDAIRRHGSVDIGIAVAIEDGLITPVLRDADRKGLIAIARESAELIERARDRKLTPDEYQGATFSISNLGMFGIDEFTAIINPPEAAILAVGATVEKPVAVEGEVVVRRRMRVTMSCDHRVIDGATGARFLSTFRAMLENPLEMML